MDFVKRYLIPRLIQYFLVIFVGVTLVFLLPRFAPADPVLQTIGALQSRGTYLDPGLMNEMIEDLTELYGLEGSMLEQYGAFWSRLFRGDFGVSFFQFPTPVNQLIRRALPWLGRRTLSAEAARLEQTMRVIQRKRVLGGI